MKKRKKCYVCKKTFYCESQDSCINLVYNSCTCYSCDKAYYKERIKNCLERFIKTCYKYQEQAVIDYTLSQL